MCAILITVVMHSNLMYSFSCYISILVTGQLFALRIDAVMEQSFKYKEHTDAKNMNSYLMLLTIPQPTNGIASTSRPLIFLSHFYQTHM